MSFAQKLKLMMVDEEGERNFVYDDADGSRVYGRKGFITCGVGHNCQVKGFSSAVIDLMFQEDAADAIGDCERVFPQFATYSDNRRLALINMAFQHGEMGLRSYKHMVAAVDQAQWAAAASYALDSQWARVESPERARRVASMIQSDIFPYS